MSVQALVNDLVLSTTYPPDRSTNAVRIAAMFHPIKDSLRLLKVKLPDLHEGELLHSLLTFGGRSHFFLARRPLNSMQDVQLKTFSVPPRGLASIREETSHKKEKLRASQTFSKSYLQASFNDPDRESPELQERMGKTRENFSPIIRFVIGSHFGGHCRIRTRLASAGFAILLVIALAITPFSTARDNGLGDAALKNGPITFPTNPFFDPGPCNSCITSFHYFVKGSSGIQTQSAPIGLCGGMCNGLFLVSAGTMYAPIGMLAESAVYDDCIGIVCGIGLATWNLKLPAGLADACVPTAGSTSDATLSSCVDVRGFDLSGTITGALGGILLTSATPVGDPTCTHFLGATPDKGNVASNACWTTDYQIVQAGQLINPPCVAGVTACITSSSVTARSNTTVINPIVNGKEYTGTFVQLGTQISQQTWYIYREITSLTFQIVPPAIVPVCAKTDAGPANVCDGNFNNCGFFATAKCDPMPVLVGSLPGLVSDINKVSLLTSTRIGFGLSTVGFGGLTCSQFDIASGNCWYGIVGVWIGGQGIQTSGCTGQNTCNFVQGIHTQLPLFQDPGLTRPAMVPSVDQLVNLAQLNNETMPQVIAANTYGQVFTYVDTQNLGVQYSSDPQACTMGTLTSCITTPAPIVINVPLVYDIIGSKSLSNWLYQYPGIPPSGGTTAGSISGRVVDGSSKNLLGHYSPIAGACIGLSAPCSGQPGQIEMQTDTDGYYLLSNVPPGTYTLYASAPGFSTVFQTNAVISVGETSAVNFILLPVNPAGVSCLVPPTPNPIPFQNAVPGIACMPNWVWYTLGAAAFGIILVAVLAWSPFGAALASGAARLLGSLAKSRHARADTSLPG